MHNVQFEIYSVVAFLLSGLILLLVDRNIYVSDAMKKEAAIARVLGWVNIAIAILIAAVYFFLYFFTRY
ncbi:CLC_0170 family protein [Cohnella lupini]|uniref:Uncharacterized protein n=1 Tax=Cohnella lupini TaxID=1294267 RepID=A0A3D9IJ62_9BACL|nr:CLC_0170 family protein [Cohnella lupini]RED61823.1 hypothetical protein DFP95_105252 [Cohnella lupini]